MLTRNVNAAFSRPSRALNYMELVGIMRETRSRSGRGGAPSPLNVYASEGSLARAHIYIYIYASMCFARVVTERARGSMEQR